MKRLSTTLLTLLIFGSAVLGAGDKDKQDGEPRFYDAPFEKVWDACVSSANENFVIEYGAKDSGILKFQVWHGGEIVGVVVRKTDDGRVRVQISSRSKSTIRAFFTGVEKYLKEGNAKV
jgi:hypothetical protein